MSYTAADRAQPAAVAVVTEAEPRDWDALTATAESLQNQSLQAWSWTIVSSTESQPPTDDPRVRVLTAPVRATASGRVLSESAGDIALVEPGTVLHPTTLEKWAWYLESNQSAPAVGGARYGMGEGEPRLLRRSDVDRAGGLDAAYGAIGDAGSGKVPWTGSLVDGEALGDEPHVWVRPTTTPNSWISDAQPFRNPLEKERPRLLLIGPWMELGGADKVNLDLMARLRLGGWELSMATTLPSPHSLLPLYARHTTDLFPLAHFLDLVDYPRFLAYLIESRGFDVVLVSNSELGYRLLPYLRARCPQPAYVDLCHSEAEHWYNGGYPRLSVEYQELLDLTVTASAHLRNWMGRRGADVDRIEVCYANVDADAITPDHEARRRVRQHFEVAADEPLLLFVGRVSEDKQPDVLAATVQCLHERGLRFTLLVAGDGPDLRRLRRFFNRCGLSKQVRLPGEIPPAQIADVYAAADVLFLPSRSEGIALVIYEAMSAGLPVVGADVGGQAELVTPQTGVLVRRGSVEEERQRYADALEPLLRDPVLRREMGIAARARIEQGFRVEHMGARMDELLRKAMRLRDESPRPVPAPGLARAVATEAIEIMRSAMTWSAWSSSHTNDGRAAARRTYLFLQRYGRPAFRLAVRRGSPGLTALRDALRRRMMGF